MAWTHVSVERQGPIALVRFDRRENRNAFNQALVRELTEAARSFHDDLETHGVVLAGAADAFSAGGGRREAAASHGHRATGRRAPRPARGAGARAAEAPPPAENASAAPARTT